MDTYEIRLLDMVQTLTERDQRGRHFTETTDPADIAGLEALGLIHVTKPVHPQTGIPYDCSDWGLSVPDLDTVEVTLEYIPEWKQQQHRNAGYDHIGAGLLRHPGDGSIRERLSVNDALRRIDDEALTPDWCRIIDLPR
jgi:hypothetical protein